MPNSEKRIDHGAAFTAPRKAALGLFEEDLSDAPSQRHRAAPRRDDELRDDGGAPAQEAAPVVDPQTRPVTPEISGLIGKAIDPIRSWIMFGKSPFSGFVQKTSVATNSAPQERQERQEHQERGDGATDKKPAVLSVATNFVRDQPILAGGVALTAILVALGIGRGHAPAPAETLPAPVQQAAQIGQQAALQPATQVAATPAAMREEILKALENIDRRLRNVEAEQQRLGAVGSRIANMEAATQSLRSQMETSASPQGEIEALRHGLDEVRGVAASLAENMDERLTKAGSVSSMPAPVRRVSPPHASPPHVRKHAPRPAPGDSALPVFPESGRSPVVGTATGSPARGFVLATSDKIDVAPGDVLPGYGRVDSVRPAEGGKMVITESGTIFIKTGAKRGQ